MLMLEPLSAMRPWSSFAPELTETPAEPSRVVTEAAPVLSGTRRIDMAGFNPAMHQLAESPDPAVVFTHLADLLVRFGCDDAVAAVLVDEQLARWQQHPPTVTGDVPTPRIDHRGPGWSLTVHILGNPAGADRAPIEPDYVAALTCGGSGAALTATDVSLIKQAGRYAAGAVQHARQAALLDIRECQMAHSRIASGVNGEIGTAVGVLMARHQLPYPQAFDLLLRASQNTNRKLAIVAGRVLHMGNLPPAAVPDES